jgi:putative transposase
MPRRPRIQLDSVPPHIAQRGHSREACFVAQEDFQTYLHWFDEYECSPHAYALMTNYVHSLVTPKRAERNPRRIRAVGRRYVQSVNRTNKRASELWDSCYKSSSIHAQRYLFSCIRYFELNPVRAGMVEDPAHLRWPSYCYNGLGEADKRITPQR